MKILLIQSSMEKKMLCLDKAFSTTRQITKQKPVIEAQSEDKFESVLFLPEGEGRQGEGGLRTQGYFKTSLKDKPLITVITVVFNGEQYLEETILSVINQTYDNIEYVVIDGGSTDGTLNIIKKYEDKIDYWVSERDNGIYNAFNKGISLVMGGFVGIINADDYYARNAVQTVVEEHLKNPGIDIFYANMYLYNEKFGEKKLIRPKSLKEIENEMCLNHPTCFIKNDLYKVYRFDEKLSLAADFDLIVYFYIHSYSFGYIDKVFAHMRDSGASSGYFISAYETYFVIRKYFGFYKASKVYLKRIVKKIIKSIVVLIIGEKKWIMMRFRD